MAVLHFPELNGMKIRKDGKQGHVSGAGMVIQQIPAGLDREKVRFCRCVDYVLTGKTDDIWLYISSVMFRIN